MDQLSEDNAKQKAEVEEKKQEWLKIRDENKAIRKRLQEQEQVIQKKKEKISADNHEYEELRKRS